MKGCEFRVSNGSGPGSTGQPQQRQSEKGCNAIGTRSLDDRFLDVKLATKVVAIDSESMSGNIWKLKQHSTAVDDGLWCS